MSESCLECKETEKKEEWNEKFLETSSCVSEYTLVENCMKITKGSISDCKEEWKQFRLCFEKNKKK